MTMGILQSLIEWGIGLFSFAALLRFYLQLFGAPYRNPVSEFAVSLTEFVLRRMRRVIPGFRGIDLTPLLWAWLLQCLLMLISLAFFGRVQPFGLLQFVPWMMAIGFVAVLRHSLYILMAAVFVLAVLSWVNPYSPVMPVADALTRPFLNPLRRIVPMIGSVDLSPVILMVIYELTLTILVGALEMLAQRLM
jgi:YggT family protein